MINMSVPGEEPKKFLAEDLSSIKYIILLNQPNYNKMIIPRSGLYNV